MNKKDAKRRNNILQKIRNFFTGKKFLEVETPIMVAIPGMEPHLDIFETKFESKSSNLSKNLYLNHSPELQMKKLLGYGFGNIFQITKVFRNGETGGDLHNPEFTMLEWYREKANYFDLMKDCEKLIIKLAGSKKIIYQRHKIDLTSPWPKKTANELFKEYCKIDLLKNRNYKTLKKTAEEKGFSTSGCKNWDDIYFKIFLNKIEPNLPLNKPLFIYDYPSTQAALAKKAKKNPFFAERFELYIHGIELANAYSELTNLHEQKFRLVEERKMRKTLNKTAFDIDEEFLLCLESIRHPCAGIAMGIDRLVMLLMNKKTISDVLLFPFKINN